MKWARLLVDGEFRPIRLVRRAKSFTLTTLLPKAHAYRTEAESTLLTGDLCLSRRLPLSKLLTT